MKEYLQLQRLIYQVAETIGHVVPTERLYILTLGSQQGNRHVRWHLAPLPPGVPYEQQQAAAIDISRGVLAIPDEEMASLGTAQHFLVVLSLELIALFEFMCQSFLSRCLLLVGHPWRFHLQEALSPERKVPYNQWLRSRWYPVR